MEDGPNFELQVPEDLEPGAYANFLSVWHTPFEFTLDFAVLQMPQLEGPEEANGVTVPARVVARVKIPPGMIFNVLQALNENMANYEKAFGAISSPGEHPPPDGEGPQQ